MIVDSHCHLNFPQFRDQLDDVLEEARKKGVGCFLTVNTCLKEFPEIQEISNRYQDVYCSVGVHPHDAKDVNFDTLKEDLIRYSQFSKTIAIGETGLDYYYNNSPKDIQIKSFVDHIDVSIQENLPIIIHTRAADQETIDILKPHNTHIRGVFHCFSGSQTLARQGLDLGFYLSFSGIVTFSKSQDLQEIVKWAPLDRLLIETDSPFLAPVPHRGKTNQPAYVHHVCQKIAELKKIPFEDVALHTTQNFNHLFMSRKK